MLRVSIGPSNAHGPGVLDVERAKLPKKGLLFRQSRRHPIKAWDFTYRRATPHNLQLTHCQTKLLKPSQQYAKGTETDHRKVNPILLDSQTLSKRAILTA